MRAFPQRRFAVLASRALAVPLVAALTVAATGGGVAQAEDGTANVAVERPIMYFGFVPDATSLALCGNGILREPPSPNPSWTLDVYGARSTGTPITGNAAASTQTGFVCVTVQKQGAPSGSYVALFRFQALPSDPPSLIVAHITWYPGHEGVIVNTSQ